MGTHYQLVLLAGVQECFDMDVCARWLDTLAEEGAGSKVGAVILYLAASFGHCAFHMYLACSCGALYACLGARLLIFAGHCSCMRDPCGRHMHIRFVKALSTGVAQRCES